MRKALVALAIACSAVWGCGGSKKQVAGDLTVSATPSGEVQGPLRMVLVFSRDMVDKGQVGQLAATLPFTVSPALPGKAKWTDEKTLAFAPSEALPVSTQFTLTVPGATRARDGAVLGVDYTTSFSTERLKVEVGIVGSDKFAARLPQARIELSQLAAFDAIAKSCSFTSGKGAPVAVKLAPEVAPGPAKHYLVVPVAELALDTEHTFVCAPSLRGTVGNIGPEKPVELAFRTYGPLKFKAMTPSGTDIVPAEDLALELAFTNPLAEPFAMTIEPKVEGFPKRCYALGGEDPGASCSVPLEARTAYTIKVAANQKDKFGQELGAEQTIEFRTSDAQPTISLESGFFVAELRHPTLPLWTRNVSKVNVTALQVTPANFHKMSPMFDWWEPKPSGLEGAGLKPVKKEIAITGEKNQWAQKRLGAQELFGGVDGPGMYYVEVGSPEVKKGVFEEGGVQKLLVNFTDIGVVSKLSGTRGLVWVTHLSTGKPWPGATVSVRDLNGKQVWSGPTDAEGVATLPPSGTLVGQKTEESWGENIRIFVTAGKDFTMLNPERVGGLASWAFNIRSEYSDRPTRLRGFMHTDRGLYRPGDKVHVKGLARLTKLGEALAPPPAGKKVKIEVHGPQGKAILDAEAKFSAFGGFWFDFDLPGDARLGDYNLHAETEWGTFSRTFSVEEFRTATFEVTGKASTERVVRKGEVAANISAKYLYGAVLREGDVNITVHSRPRDTEVKGFDQFSFFDERRYQSYSYYGSEPEQTLVTEQKTKLDDNGNASFKIPVSQNEINGDVDLLVRAAVVSPANEQISKTFTIPYHRSTRYFGVKTPGWSLELGKPQKIAIASVGPDGAFVDGPAKVTVYRNDWNCVWEDWGYRGSYQCQDNKTTLVDKVVTLSGGKPAEVEILADKGGEYWVLVEGVDDKAKDESAAAARQMYAWGGDAAWRSSDSLTFDIVTDKKEYQPGDTATLMLKTDLAAATGLVTIERDGVLERRLIDLTATGKSIQVPVTAAHAPNVYVSVVLVQGRTGDGARGKPRMRMGLVNLPVQPKETTLKVSVETDAADYRPGAPVTATVKVTDEAGAPVSAEVSITAADEGILSLIAYQTPDPVPTFYASWGLGVQTVTQLEFLRDLPGPNLTRPATGGDAAGSLRSRFVATPVWAPGAITDANGTAKVTFAAPDNLTAFRVMAVAADKGHRFGSSDKRFTVSKPLQLHAAVPRLVRLGDKLTAGVVVHNDTGKAGAATIKLVPDDKVTASGTLERTVQLPVGAQVPVMFELAGATLGTSRLAFTVVMGAEKDGLEVTLPVQHPSPVRTQHVALAASKAPVNVPLALPATAIPDGAQLVISVDPDGLSGLERGLEDLVEYPYGCLEQTTSKVIPMLAVRDLAEQLSVNGLAGPALDKFVMQGLAKIGRHQTPNGGFSLWPGGEADAYYTAYALWGLQQAQKAGYRVDTSRIDDALQYLRNDGKQPDTTRPYYDAHGDAASQAFALYVRALLGDKDVQAATKLAADGKLTAFGKAWLARALALDLGATDPAVTKLVEELGALATQAAAAGALVDDPAEKNLDYYMASPMRTTAAVLSTLVELSPKHAAIKPLVAVVMKQRRAERYLDTQENLYSLVALTSYSRTASTAAPSVTVSLAGKELITGALAGKQRMRVVTVPFVAGELSIAPKGEVSYSVDLRYREVPSTIKAVAAGIEVAREYLDEKRAPKTTFKVNDVVVVRLTTTVTKDDAAHHVISDPIPAGFEVLNARLATVGGAVMQSEEWGAFREIRDDRVDFVAEWISEHSVVREYSMRATTPGTFTLPPAVSELMYSPEINGQTGLSTIEILPK